MKLTPTQTADVLTRFDDSKRAVANLMARENISVQIVDGADTASFDPVSRILTIPNWNTLSLDQVDLLMAHEIGHALFSTADIYEKLAKDKKSLFGYVNIVEDARIERKMKNAFPGLARVFYNGYHQFTTDGPIFKVIDRDHMLNTRTGQATAIAKMKLIDRINLYFKIGAFVNVPFSETERQWIERIDKCGSMEQAIEIARQLHKLAKETEKPEPKQPQSPQKSKQKSKAQPQDDQDDESDSSDDSGNDSSDDSKDDESNDDSGTDESDSDKSTDGDDDESKSGDDESDDESGDDQDGDDESKSGDDKSDDEGDESKDGDKSDDESDAKDGDEGDEQGDKPSTDDSDADDVESPETGDTDELLKKHANKPVDGRIEIRHLTLSPVDAETLKARTVTADQWAQDATDCMKGQYANIDSTLDILSQEWDARLMSTASQMALEFERRKTAKQYQNARVAKTGKLNLAKLSQYKFTDDMFLRSMSLPNGKSHGVVMIIDGSGSMSGCFANVIDQVLLFAHFAQKVNIPFEAYMFTSQTAHGSRYSDPLPEHKPGFNAIALDPQGSIVGLVNTKSDRASFKRQVRACLAMRQRFARDCQSVSYEATYAFSTIPYINLGSTPLFTGILLAERALARMKSQHRLDKTTFIVVSDGEDTSSLRFETMGVDRHSGATVAKWEDIENAGLVVRDTVTKRNLVQVETWTDYDGRQSHRCPTNGALTMLLDVIKLRHDSRIVYLYLQSSSYGYNPYSRYRRRRRVAPVTCDGFTSLVRAGKLEAAQNVSLESVTNELKANGQYVLPTDLAVADLSIILRTSTLELTEDEFAKLDADGLSQRKIAQAFTKSMVKAVANRVFVNTVVPHLI
jgi:Mg-chelatase subunit ChlD